MAETWLTAADAEDLGFADEFLNPVKLAARAKVKRFELPAERGCGPELTLSGPHG